MAVDWSGGILTNIIVCKDIVLLINQKDYEHFNELWGETVRLWGFAVLVFSVNSLLRTRLPPSPKLRWTSWRARGDRTLWHFDDTPFDILLRPRGTTKNSGYGAAGKLWRTRTVESRHFDDTPFDILLRPRGTTKNSGYGAAGKLWQTRTVESRRVGMGFLFGWKMLTIMKFLRFYELFGLLVVFWLYGFSSRIIATMASDTSSGVVI